MTRLQKLEVLGGLLIAGGFAVIHIALGAIVLGVLLVFWANFGDLEGVEQAEEEATDAGSA